MAFQKAAKLGYSETFRVPTVPRPEVYSSLAPAWRTSMNVSPGSFRSNSSASAMAISTSGKLLVPRKAPLDSKKGLTTGCWKPRT